METIQTDQLGIHVVDLSAGKEEILKKIKMAATTIGFFQVVNHGVPENLMETMLKWTRKLHELPEEEKLRYSTDPTKGRGIISLNSVDQGTHVKSFMVNQPLVNLPEMFGDVMIDYSQHMKRVGTCLLEALSDLLELKNENLIDMDCAKQQSLLLHYYPPRTETASDFGLLTHADRSFLTILLQDQIGGLEVLYEGQWLNIPPDSGSFIVNIGDLLKLLSNGKLVSSEHRVWANVAQPRFSIPCFFVGDLTSSKMLGPINELLSKTNPALYRHTTYKDYIYNCRTSRLDGTSTLMHLMM